MTSGDSETPGAGTTVETDIGLLYGPDGKRLDLYRPAGTTGPLPTVLLWHGIGPDERDVLAPLARTAAARGLLILVPDWRSDAANGGRSQLLASLAFTRKEAAGLGGDGESVVLAGWSAGAGAALGVALRPEVAEEWRPKAVVGVAGRYDVPARTTGTAPLADLAAGRDPVVPVHLVHGSRDPIVAPRYSRDLADALRAAGRPVTLQEPDTDHAGVIMTAYDPTTDRCVPTRDGAAVAAGHLVAGVLAAAGGARRAPPTLSEPCNPAGPQVGPRRPHPPDDHALSIRTRSASSRRLTSWAGGLCHGSCVPTYGRTRRLSSPHNRSRPGGTRRTCTSRRGSSAAVEAALAVAMAVTQRTPVPLLPR